MKLYTRRGDGGQTDLLGGERVAKSHPRVAATGDIDELNAQLGVARCASGHDDIRVLVHQVQSALFGLGAALAAPDPAAREKIGIAVQGSDAVAELEARIDAFDAEVEPLRTFILPGGGPGASHFHVARAVCRRAERALAGLETDDPAVGVALRYLNRLSDLLFAIARVENARASIPDIPWTGGRS